MDAEQLARRIESVVTGDANASAPGCTYDLVSHLMKKVGAAAGSELTRAASQNLVNDGILPNVTVNNYMSSDSVAEATLALDGNPFQQNASSALATQIEVQRREVQSARGRT